jgi:putative mRNA 3-end processing factor
LRSKNLLLGNGKKISISLGNGIVVKMPELTIALDPKSNSECKYSFVSHAHLDHVHSPKGVSKVVASKETVSLARARGYDLSRSVEQIPGMELVDAGHILGSRGALIEDRVYYTGDVSTRDRGFLKGFRGVKCEILIMETTYGRSRYVFPDINSLAHEVNKFIAASYDRGLPVLLTGYPLGKAQIISRLFDTWEPVFLHHSVFKMNSEYRALGVNLKEFEEYSQSPDFERVMRRGPWVMIAPSFSRSSAFVSDIVKNYHASVATFTGWAVDLCRTYRSASEKRQYHDDDEEEEGFRRGGGRKTRVEYFPLSDHCDFRELVELVKYCNPSKIYTVHGFAKDFASYLNSIGFDAEPLSIEDDQMSISMFAT